MENYKRGELVDKALGESGSLERNEIIARGEAMETLVGTDGWKYFADWMEETTDKYIRILTDLRQNDIDKINDLRIIISVYRGLIKKPQKWISVKNMEEKKRRKQ